MKIEKYSEFNDDQLNESFWDDVKYGLSKLGRYKAGGKILGKKETDETSKLELREIMKKESNKLLKQVYGEVAIVAPEFPNDRKKITFLRGVIMYGQLYDSLVAAAKKNPKEEGYMSPEVVNSIIEDMRKVVKKFLDVDLKAVYTVAESKQDNITDEDIFELSQSLELEALNEEEEFLKKLSQLKDKAMDKLFGAKKGSDAEQKTTKGQSAKLQKTSGETNVESERMKTLQSNKLPLVLAGLGGALGALGWLAQTEWMKNLIIEWFGGDKVVTNTQEVVTKITGGDADSKGLVHWMSQINKAQGGGDIRTGADVTSFINKFGGVDNMKGFFIGNGGGDAIKQAEILQQICSSSPTAGVGDIFTKAAGTFGSMKGGQNLFGISNQANFVGKTIKTQVTKQLVKGTGTAIASKVAGVGKVLTGVGIALIATGAVVKLLREKGQRQSRAKTLNDLLQSLVFVEVGAKKGGDEEGKDKGENKGEESTNIPTEKSIYPLMIKNLTQLKSLIITSAGVKLEGEGGDKGAGNIRIGKEYYFTNKKGDKKKVKVISLTHDTTVGKDRTWLTKDDVKQTTLAKGKASVIFKDKKGEYTASSPEMAVSFDQLSPVKESISISKFDDIVLEDKKFGTQRNVEVTKGEDYLTQAVSNIRKSLKSIVDEKDKGIGITEDFIQEILDKKMDSNTKAPVKELYAEVYDYLYGKKASTLGDFAPLYKESVEIISNKGKRQVVAEKMARFTKRSLQFEGEGFYGGMGEFGADLEDFNKTFKEIMSYFKSKSEVKESKIFRFKDL